MKYVIYGIIAVIALVVAGRCLLVDSANQAGIDHVEQGEYDKATDEFTRAIELDDSNATLFKNRAWTHRSSKNYRQALLDYDRAIELDSEDADSHNGRGLTHYDLGDPRRAIVDFDSAIELDPSNTTYYRNRALAYKGMEEYQLAIEDYTRAIDLDLNEADSLLGRALVYVEIRNLPAAQEDLDRAAELAPEDENIRDYRTVVPQMARDEAASVFVDSGATNFEQGNYVDAALDFEEAIKVDPENSAHYGSRAVAYLALDEYEWAVEDLDRAIRIDPDDPTYYSSRAMAYGFLGEHEKAVVDWTRAIRLDPDNANLYNGRGVSLAFNEEYSKAISDLEKVLELDPAPSKRAEVEARLCTKLRKEQDKLTRPYHHERSSHAHPARCHCIPTQSICAYVPGEDMDESPSAAGRRSPGHAQEDRYLRAHGTQRRARLCSVPPRSQPRCVVIAPTEPCPAVAPGRASGSG